MKIIGCHIAGFGCYEDADFTFGDGLNTVLQANGTGKSTLQAFIRVMLYGFRNETKKIKDREREIRRPWRTSVYGGTIDVESAGKIYRIERTFGTKAAEDRFMTYDLSARCLTGELTETPGKALFGVDSDTFERTAFISEDGIRTYVSDGVHAKIGNLSEDPADVNRYEKAEKLLQDFLNRNSSGRSTGELYKLNDRITMIGQEIAAADSVESQLAENERMLGEMRKKEQFLKEEADLLSEKQRELSAFQSLSAKRASYEELKKTLEERELSAKRDRNAFPGAVPSEAELKKAAEWHSEALTAKRLSENERLSEADEALLREYAEEFRNGPADPEEADALISTAGRLQESRAELRAKKGERERDKAEDEAEAAAAKKTAIRSFIWSLPVLAAFIGLLIWTAVSGFRNAAVWQFVLVGATALLFAVLAVFGMHSYGKSKRLRDRLIRVYTESGEALEKEEEVLSPAEEKIRAFLSSFGRTFQPDLAGKKIMDVLKNQTAYQVLQGKKKRLEDYEKMRSDAETRLSGFLCGVLGEEARKEEPEAVLNRLNEMTAALKTSGEECRRAKQAVERFEAEHDVMALTLIRQPESRETLEEVASGLEKNRKDTDGLRDLETRYEQENERLRERLSDLEDASARLGELKEERSALQEKVRIMEKTKAFLAEAKRSLAEKYADPVEKSFEAYAKTILGDTGLKFELGSDGTAVIEDRGMIRSVDLFSSGYQVLTYFCLRLSLVDAMYENERPVLFLDDPFAELDEDKLEKAKALLQSAAKRYQILYFTCHPSRA